MPCLPASLVHLATPQRNYKTNLPLLLAAVLGPLERGDVGGCAALGGGRVHAGAGGEEDARDGRVAALHRRVQRGRLQEAVAAIRERRMSSREVTRMITFLLFIVSFNFTAKLPKFYLCCAASPQINN